MYRFRSCRQAFSNKMNKIITAANDFTVWHSYGFAVSTSLTTRRICIICFGNFRRRSLIMKTSSWSSQYMGYVSSTCFVEISFILREMGNSSCTRLGMRSSVSAVDSGGVPAAAILPSIPKLFPAISWKLPVREQH